MDIEIRRLERLAAQNPEDMSAKLRLYREKRRCNRPVSWTEFGFEPATKIFDVGKTTRIYFTENKRVELEVTGVTRIDSAAVKIDLVTMRSKVAYGSDKGTLMRLAERGWQVIGNSATKNGGIEGLQLDMLVQEVMYEVLSGS